MPPDGTSPSETEADVEEDSSKQTCGSEEECDAVKLTESEK